MTNDQITVSRALLQQAIDALSDTQKDGESPQWDIEKAAYDALRAALEQPAVEPLRSTAISECLQVLRPTVKGKFPQEQALDELAGYLAAPQALQQKIERLEHVHKATADLLLDSDTLLKQALGELESEKELRRIGDFAAQIEIRRLNGIIDALNAVDAE